MGLPRHHARTKSPVDPLDRLRSDLFLRPSFPKLQNSCRGAEETPQSLSGRIGRAPLRPCLEDLRSNRSGTSWILSFYFLDASTTHPLNRSRSFNSLLSMLHILLCSCHLSLTVHSGWSHGAADSTSSTRGCGLPFGSTTSVSVGIGRIAFGLIPWLEDLRSNRSGTNDHSFLLKCHLN